MSAPDRYAERLLVLELAGDERGRRRASLHRSFADLLPSRIDQAIEGLRIAGVLQSGGAGLIQTPALARIDALGLIAL
jgi:hypothetical protein